MHGNRWLTALSAGIGSLIAIASIYLLVASGLMTLPRAIALVLLITVVLWLLWGNRTGR